VISFINSFFKKAMLKVIVDFRTLLICAEGTRLLENAIAFSSCVGKFKDANQCPAGLAGQGETPQARSAEEAHRPPAESEVPGAQINSLVYHSL
jgi:hypothetical protein